MALLTVAKLLETTGRRVRASMISPRVRRQVRAFGEPYRLHLGSGAHHLNGWINIDMYPNPGVVDIAWDLTDGIPAHDGTCALIYCEHLLEHLSVQEGLAFFAECRRVLVRGGVLRVAMPSLDVLVERASGAEWRSQAWLSFPENRYIETRAEMLNVAFRAWGHQWLYDREELRRRMGEAGFTSIRDAPHGHSAVADLCGLETREDSLLICEAIRD